MHIRSLIIASAFSLFATGAFSQAEPPNVNSMVGDTVINPATGEEVEVVGLIEDVNGVTQYVIASDGDGIATETAVGNTIALTADTAQLNDLAVGDYEIIQQNLGSFGYVDSLKIRLIQDPQPDPPNPLLDYAVVTSGTEDPPQGEDGNPIQPPATGAPEAPAPQLTSGKIYNVVKGAGGNDGDDGYGVRICLPFGIGCATIGYSGSSGGNGSQPSPYVLTIPDSYNSGSITSTGDTEPAITVGRVGGDGGQGGDAYGNFQAKPGGNGGAGGNVTVTNNVDTQTSGENSYGMYIFSRAGQSGAGGTGYLFGSGGQGGAALDGGSVNATNNAQVNTSGDGAHGVRVFSTGGAAGSGGGSWGLVGSSGNGADGGNGGAVTVNNNSNGALVTTGADAHGILAQSIGGSGGDSGSGGGLYVEAGASAGGGNGSTVTVNNSGVISTQNDGSNGILAQSIGGGGGSGGDVGGLVALSGSGGGGGHGSTVVVNNSGQVSTDGNRADAVFAQSVGGGGGTGGGSGGLVASSAGGGGGGNGGNVTVNNSGVLQTSGSDSRGIAAQSIGGGGGNGGGAGGLVALAGNGGGAGQGGNVSVDNEGQIFTDGLGSDAIFAQSVGGGGGSGAASGGLVAVSGSGGGGTGIGGVVEVINNALLQTQAGSSFGIFAQSVGGGGGSGGAGGGLVALSGGGGGASSGGAVTVTNNQAGKISTFGDNSGAIYAQSVGGGGGRGAASGGLVAVSTSGGGAGNGGEVTVTSHGDLQTRGSGSEGIFAQSIGGGGGAGGEAGGLVAIGGDGGGAGFGSNVTVTNSGQILTGAEGAAGTGSSAIYAQSIGGGGGSGAPTGGLVAVPGDGGGGQGKGGEVRVTNTGLLKTYFEESFGIFAESVGGGGGSGGGSGGLVALGGQGGGAASGDLVDVDNDGNIFTFGANSGAIYAQSVGGGGGRGAASGGLVAVSTSGGGAGNGGEVVVNNTGALSTAGTGSEGIFAQSIGGGGGAGGEAGGLVAIGGDGGGAGFGSNVTVTNTGQIFTGLEGVAGTGSSAIYAQSIGGGGGTGAPTGGLVAVPGDGGGGDGKGGQVRVTNSGILRTYFEDSFGIFAQSVGGGGGSGGGSGGLVALGGEGGGAANGDLVDVINNGNILTFGANSDAIYAQSVGGGGGRGAASGGLVAVSTAGGGAGSGGEVTVANTAVLVTRGQASKGIFAQSIGGGGGTGGEAGGLVALSGDGGGAGDGNDVTVTNSGSITTSALDRQKSSATYSFAGELDDGQDCETNVDCEQLYLDKITDGHVNLDIDGGDFYSIRTVDASSVEIVIYDRAASSTALYAQSVGGGGGTGTPSGGLVAVSGNGGGEGNGGVVSATNSSTLQTSGSNSYGIFAQSVGGAGGDGGASGGLAAVSGDGGGAGFGGTVIVDNNTGGDITTSGINSTAIFAESVGGGGGVGEPGGGLGAVGGDGGTAGYGGSVTVTNDANLITEGDFSKGIFAQSVGGGGGAAGEAGGVGSVGGEGGAGKYGGAVHVESTGNITTSGRGATGIFAQSIGGGGGDAGDGGGLFTWGGDGDGDGLGALGGIVTVKNFGEIITTGNGAKGIFAQSVGGGGGSGGSAYGVFVTVGGDGGNGSEGGDVDVTHGGSIHTSGISATGIHAQSVGGSGGDGGSSYSGSLFFGYALGGDGGNGALGGDVDVTLGRYLNDVLQNRSMITTDSGRSTGILAHSVGGGGGSGGKSVQASAGAFINMSVSIGGTGGTGGQGGIVNLDGAGDVLTKGDVSPGVILQSVGGGGGNGGSSVSVSVAAGEGVSLAGSVALGGDGGAAGDGGSVTADVDSNIETRGAFSTGFLAQSVGGGGGNGGNAVSVAASFSDGAAGAVGVGLGGDGNSGGLGGIVDVSYSGSVTTQQAQSDGLVIQSVGGGGGNGGTTVAASLGAAAGGGGNFSLALGGKGGGGGIGGKAKAIILGDVSVAGDGSDGVIVQSIGGGGGNSGLTVGAGAAGAVGAAASVNVALGATGGSGGAGGLVDAYYDGILSTIGNSATGILAQSVGGGGGNAGGTIAAGIAGALGGASGALGVSIGGDGGGGGNGGVAEAVTTITTPLGDRIYEFAVSLETEGSVATNGENSAGIIAQSIGGGGGNGGYSVSGTLAGAAVGAGTIGVSLGGDGEGGGVGMDVLADIESTVITSGGASRGVLVQSVGGGGGTGGLSVSAGIAGAGVAAASLNVGLGGSGGTGAIGGDVNATSTRAIETRGDQSHAFIAQSIGGGGGSGGGNVSASINGASTASGGINVGLGGSGGTAGHGGSVIAATSGNVVTYGRQSVGILAQSVGGGGGDGNFNVAAGISGAGVANGQIGVGLGGNGGAAGDGGEVSLTVTNNVLTFGGDGSGAIVGSSDYLDTLLAAYADPFNAFPVGDDADAGAVIAQSIGGGGGNGGLNVTASAGGSGVGSGGVNVGLGGSGEGGGSGGAVTAAVEGTILTVGNGSNGVLAQSIGGGGGNGAINIAGTISGAGVGNGAVTVGLGGDGDLGGTGGVVTLDLDGPVTTFGDRARGVVAQSIGGGGGNGAVNIGGTLAGAGTGNGDLTVAVGGSGGGGGDSGRVDADVSGNIYTVGDFSDGFIAQTIGGGGGNSAINIGAAISGGGIGNGSGKISLGGAGGSASNSDIVDALYSGLITTFGDYSRGMLAQSVGGGGGNAAGNVAAGISGAGTGNGDLVVGVGGDGGGAGDGGREGVALAVTAEAHGQIVTYGKNSGAFTAQSIGGGGGSGGYNVSASGSGAGTGAGGVGIGLGGDGSGGGAGKGVDADISANIWTYGESSGGILAQSVGGGGGDGGFNVTAVGTGAGTGAGAVTVGLGGTGANGGSSGRVDADSTGTVFTEGDNSTGFLAQSVGGGGGNGGFNVNVSIAGSGTGSGAVGVGLGGDGDVGGDAGEVYASTDKTVTTKGDNSAGVVAQSIGGGGGNGGFNVTVSVSGAATGSGSVGVGLGGGGAGGGVGKRVELTVDEDVTTSGANSAGVIAQSLGGGGGNGGFNVAVPLSGAGTGSGAVAVGLGGDGGTASDGGTVIFRGETDVITGDVADFDSGRLGVEKQRTEYAFVSEPDPDCTLFDCLALTIPVIDGDDELITSMGSVNCFESNCSVFVEAAIANGDIEIDLGPGEQWELEVIDAETIELVIYERKIASGDFSQGVVVQSIGGGGGNGGFDVSATISGAEKGSGALSVSLGGDGDGGGAGGIVDSFLTGLIETAGFGSNGLTVQSVGGGGGNGNFSVAGALSGASQASGAGAISLGGTGAGGGNGNTVDSVHTGAVATLGDYSNGAVVQSIGGGGGNGGFAVAGGISVAKEGSGALTVGIGGSGGSGGSAGMVTGEQYGNVSTAGDFSSGVIVQSLGGGGGNGGFSVSGNISAAKNGSGALAVGVGGTGGSAGFAMDATSTVNALVQTLGDNSDGIFTQSLGGGGGNGGFNVSGSLTASKEGSGNLAVGIGGFGGEGGYAGAASSTVIGGALTSGDNSNGIVTQSLGGGGGNGALNVAGSVNITSEGSGGNLGVGIGGFGGDGGDAGTVSSKVTMTEQYDRVTTTGNNSIGILAQSVGGGGGNGGINVTGTLNGTSKSGGSVGFGLGGFGAGAGDGKKVTLDVDGLVVTQGNNSHGLMAQSVGGAGGNGGMNVTGSVAITKSSQSATQVGVAIGVGGFGGGGGIAGDVDVDHTGSIFAGMGLRELIPESTDTITGEVTPAYYVLRDAPGYTVPAIRQVVLDSNGDPELDDQGNQVTEVVLPSYVVGLDQKGGSGLIAQSIGGGGGTGGMNVSGSISAGFGDDASGYGIVVGVGGFGGAGGDAGEVDVDVVSEDIVATGNGRSGVLAQSIGGGGGDGGTNVSGSISTDAPLLVGVGGFGADAGKGKAVTVKAVADIDVLGLGALAGANDDLADSDDKLNGDERRPDLMSAGVMAQSIGGGGGNGGLNVSGALVTSKSQGVPAINVGIGGYGGDGATSDDVTVDHEGSINIAGEYAHGVLAQSIGGGGGNGATNVSGQVSKASGTEGEAGGNSDISIVVGVGGSGGEAAKSGDVTVTQFGQVTTKGDNSRGIFAQSISDGGGFGGLNVSALVGTKTSPVIVGVGGSGGDGASAGNVAVFRGDSTSDAGAIVTDGEAAHGIEASTVSGGGGDAGANIAFSAVQANKAPGDPGFTASIGIGGGGGEAADAGNALINNYSNVITLQNKSHGVFAQSIGGGGGNANFNVALGIAKGGDKPENDNSPKGVSLAVGGATGNGGSGGQVDVVQVGNVDTTGDNSYGIFAQSIGGGGGNAGFDMNMAMADGGDLGVKIGRKGGTGGHGGDVTLGFDSIIRTRGNTSHGALAQSIGNGGGNSSASKVGLKGANTGNGANSVSFALGVEGGEAGYAGAVTLTAKGAVITEQDDSRGIFAQSVGGGGGNAGGASVFGLINAGSGLAIGAEGGEGGYGGLVSVDSSADVLTAGERSAGILAQSLGGGGGNGSSSKSGGTGGTNSGINVSIGGTGGKGNYGGAVDVDNDGVIITEGDNSVGVLAQSIGGGGGQGGAAFSGVLRANNPEEPTRVSLAFGGEGGEGGYGSAVTVNNYNGVGTFGYRSSGIFAQSVGGGGGVGGTSTVMTAEGDQGAQNVSLALGGSGGSAATGGVVTVNNLLTENSEGVISTYGNSAHGIVAMSVGGGGGDAGGSYIVNRQGTTDAAMQAKAISVALGGAGGEGGTGGAVNVKNEGIIVTRGDRAHGIYATSIGGGGGNGGTSFIGEYVLGLPSLSGGNEANLQLAVGGAGGDGNFGGNVLVENSGTITVNGEQAFGIYAQSVGGGGGTGGMAITASKDIVNYKEPVKSLQKIAVGGFGGDANNGGDVKVLHTGDIFVNGNDSIGIFAESIGGAGGHAGSSISSPVWMAADLLLDFLVGGGNNGQAGDVSVEYEGNIVIAEDATGSQGVILQKVNGGGGNSDFYYDLSQQAKQLGEGGYDLPNNEGFKDQAFGFIKGTLKAGGKAIHPDANLGEESPAPTSFDVEGGVFGQAANGLGTLTQSITGGGGRSVTTLVLQQDGNEATAGEVEVQDSVLLSEEGREKLQELADQNDMELDDVELGDLIEQVLDDNPGFRTGSSADLVAELGGTDIDGASAGAVEYSQSGDLVMLGDDSQGALVQSIGGGGGQLELRLYTAPEIPNPAPIESLPIGQQSASETLDSPVPLQASLGAPAPLAAALIEPLTPVIPAVPNFRVLTSQVGTIGGSNNNGGEVTASRSGVVMTTGDYSPGVVMQSIGAGGGQLSSTGFDVMMLAVGATGGASGDGADISYSNDGDVYTSGILSHGVVVQTIGGGGGLSISDTSADNVFVSRNVDNKGDGGNVNYAQAGNVLTEGERSYGIAIQSLGGGGGIVDSEFFGASGGEGIAKDVFVQLAGSATVSGNSGIALLAQTEARDGSGNIGFDVSGTLTAAGDFSTGLLGITRSDADSGDMAILLGGDAIASGISAVGLDILQQSVLSVGKIDVDVAGNVSASGKDSTGIRGGAVSDKISEATSLIIGGSAVANGGGSTAIDLALTGGELAADIGLSVGRDLIAVGYASTGVSLLSDAQTAGAVGARVDGNVISNGTGSVGISAASVGVSESGNINVKVNGSLSAGGPSSIGIAAESVSDTVTGFVGVAVDGKVRVDGENAFGITVRSSEGTGVAIGSNAVVSGDSARGIEQISSDGPVRTSVEGFIAVEGDSASGAIAVARTTNTFTVASAVEASGAGSLGVELIGRNIEAEVGGPVLALAELAMGVSARSRSDVSFEVGSAVSASGESATGVSIESIGGSVLLDIAEFISASGDFSAAVRALANDSLQLNVASAVESAGESAMGVDLVSDQGDSSVAIGGYVLASGDSSTGVRSVSRESSSLVVGSAVEASGDNAAGIDVKSYRDSAQLAVKGVVLASGDSSSAVRMVANNGGLVSMDAGSSVVTQGEGSLAVNLRSDGASTSGISLAVEDDLQVSGRSSTGVQAKANGSSDSSVAQIALGGRVLVDADNARGLAVSTKSSESSADIALDVGGLIFTSGAQAQGITLATEGTQASGSVVALIGGEAANIGQDSTLLKASSVSESGSSGDVAVAISQSLITDASSATGLRLVSSSGTTSGSISANIGGNLVTAGTAAQGVNVRASSTGTSSDVDITVASDTLAEGERANGVDIVTNGEQSSGNVDLNFGGNVLALGDGAFGAKGRSNGGNSSGNLFAIIEGSALAEGKNSVALDLVSRSEGSAGSIISAVNDDAFASGRKSTAVRLQSFGGDSSGNIDLSLAGALTAFGENSRGVAMRSFGDNVSGGLVFELAGLAQGEGTGLTLIELVSESSANSSDSVTTSEFALSGNSLRTSVASPLIAGAYSGSVNSASPKNLTPLPGSQSGNVSVTLAESLMVMGENSRGIVLTSSSDGVAGNVSLYAASNMAVSGPDSSLIVAQSVGGDQSGDVDIALNGNVAALGSQTVAVTARSVSGTGAVGNITIANQMGQNLYAGSGGIGVKIDGGDANSVVLRGESMTTDGLSGDVIIASTGNDVIENFGSLIGEFNLGSGVNRFINNAGATLVTGPSLAVGRNQSWLVNEGTMAIGGVANAQSTALIGSFEQTAAAEAYAELDFGTDVIDQIVATDRVKLDGKLYLTLMNPGLVPSGEFSRALYTGEAGVEDAGLQLITNESLVINYAINYSSGTAAMLDYTVDFAPSWLMVNQRDVGAYLNRVQSVRSSDALSQTIVQLLYQENRDQYAGYLTSMTPEFYGEQVLQFVKSSQTFANKMLSCKQAGGDYRFTSEGNCAWVHAGFESLEYDEFGSSEFDSNVYSLGSQVAFGEHWFAGIGASREDIDGEGNKKAWSSDGTTTQLGFSLKYQPNQWKFASVLTYGRNETETIRNGRVAESFSARGDRDSESLGLLLYGGYDFEFSKSYLRPTLELGVNRINAEDLVEAGAAELDLVLAETSETFTWIKPSVEAGYEYALENSGRVRFYARAGLRRYMGDDYTEVEAGLAGAGILADPISTEIGLGQNSILGAVGIDVLFSNEMTLQLQYRHETADDIELNAGQLKFSMPF